MARRNNAGEIVIRARLGLALLPVSTGESDWRPEVLDRNLPADVHLSAARLAHRQDRMDVAKTEYRLTIRKSDESRSGLISEAQARMGLAMLEKDEGDPAKAADQISKALTLLRRAGSPRLIAHALLINAGLGASAMETVDMLRRALAIYTTLEDRDGQRACLEPLIEASGRLGDDEAVARYRRLMKALDEE